MARYYIGGFWLLFFCALAWQSFSPSAVKCKGLGGRYFLLDGCVKEVPVQLIHIPLE